MVVKRQGPVSLQDHLSKFVLPGSPRYDIFVVDNYADEAGGEKSSWTRLGVAFPHKDAKGFNVELRAVPISGKLVIRLHEPSEKAPG